ncbi:MAG: ferritin-like domain-containing protein [Myxococcales bacterium]|nr:ferritin-like domain-containing protein [Myxococcales bacterium]
MRADDPTARLRARILAQLAPFLLAPIAACGPDGSDGGDDGVGTTSPEGMDGTADAADAGNSGGSSDATGSSSDSTGDGTTETEDTTDTGGCTASFPGDPSTFDEFPECPIDLASYFDPDIYIVCIEARSEADCAELCTPICGLPCAIDIGDNLQSCDPYFDAELGMCCSLIVSEPIIGTEGRPFRPDAGTPRLASVADADQGWARRLADSSPMLPTTVRKRLAAHWLRAALGEHASVASFARFAAQLQRLGAPPSLVREALSAAGDEVRHAEAAFSLASRYAGRPLGAGPIPTHDGLRAIANLRAAVHEVVIEGCIAETLSAHELGLLAGCVQDPVVRAIVRQIAEDEARHAGLAWRFVAWALARQPALRNEVHDLLEVGIGRARPVDFDMVDVAEGAHASLMLAHGCACPSTRAAWRMRGLEEVVRVCANFLAPNKHCRS